jgi:hypothetical protein
MDDSCDSCKCSDGTLDERQSLGGSLQGWKPAKLEACKALMAFEVKGRDASLPHNRLTSLTPAT